MRAPASSSSGNSLLVAAFAIAIALLGCKGTAPTQMKEPQPATAPTNASEADAAPPDLAK